MIYTSFAMLALLASAAMPNLSNVVHLHPRTAPDTRISVRLVNDTPRFQDVKVDGHVYTVLGHQTLRVKAPAGTVIYSESRTMSYRRGDAMLTMSPALDNHNVLLN